MPPAIVGTCEETSNKKVLEHLKQLSSDWTVFVEWRFDDGTDRYEADFLILNPYLGILVLEVKGGRISVDSEGNWWSKDWYEMTHRIKNPMRQAEAVMHYLINKYNPKLRPNLPFVSAVAFPDVVCQARVGSIEENLIIGSNHLNDINRRLTGIMQLGVTRWAPNGVNQVWLKEVVDDLRRKQQLEPQFPLAEAMEWAGKRISELTEAQKNIMDATRDWPGALVEGCAGSGKTILAIHKAAQLHRAGKKVLLLCCNPNLAQEIGLQLMGLEVISLAQFGKTQGVWPIPEDIGVWAERLRAAGPAPQKYDALLVDEAQDFGADLLVCIRNRVLDKDGVFFVFRDSNQEVYGNSWRPKDIGITNSALWLPKVVRNTQNIFKVFCPLYRGPGEAICENPPGPDVQFIRADSEEQQGTALAKVLQDLTQYQRVTPQSIVVLVSKRHHPVFHSQKKNVTYRTVAEFKGLESSVVILLAGDNSENSLLYVGCSRAREMLVVIGPREVCNRLQ